MYKIILFLILISFKLFSQPVNNNCANATALTIGTQLCSQNSTNANLQPNECYINFAGQTEGSMWYSFTATSPTLVFSILQTNTTNCAPYYAIWGPYPNVSTGCSAVLNGCVSTPTVLSTATPTNYIYNIGGYNYVDMYYTDLGVYVSLNGLNTTPGNNTYLIQMINENCGGPYDRWTKFCIGLHNPATNSTPSGASLINQCGIQYSSFTSGGYAPSQSLSNIDNNTSTSCPSSFGGNCNGSNGNDVPFVINNPSYFTFCATATGTYNIKFDVVACTQTLSGAQGLQMAILLGSANSMTLNQVATNPMLPSSPIWTSSNFTLNTGQCAYLVVDGFAGDQCSYSYTLNNVGGSGCFLPIELINFGIKEFENYNLLFWETATEINNDYFILEKSYDGINFYQLGKIKGAGTSYFKNTYSFIDGNITNDIVYYRLKQFDFNGESKVVGLIDVKRTSKILNGFNVEIIPNPSDAFIDVIINYFKESIINISIINLDGKIIFNEIEKIEPGKSIISFDLRNLEDGMYFVKVEIDKFIKTKKIIKNGRQN